MEKNILDNLKMVKDMVKVSKSGKITHSIKDIGKMIKLMGKEELSIHKVMLMKVTGKMIRRMVMALTTILMDKNIQEDGLTISNTDMVSKNGQMEQPTMGIFELIKQL
jgi:hypothetical protein